MEGIVTALALLVCPVGMGAMMWFMARGMRGGEQRSGQSPSVEDLRAEQRQIAAEIDRVDRERRAPEHAAGAVVAEQPAG